MKIVIQKFGGTSVSTKERRIMAVEKISKAIEEGYLPVVVVSAMGRKGQPYATDSLLGLVGTEFKSRNSRAIDLLMSCGEIITTVVMCEELMQNGFNAVPLTGGQSGIITDDNYNNADVLRVETDTLINLLKENKVPVVAGFQGQSEYGFTTTLGRGGSDVTAALLGAALKAERVEIFTDVDGIMTADPRIVSDASLIKEISYNEVFQLADQGAKVIHPRAVEIAMRANIPLLIKNTLSDCIGTLINSIGTNDSNNVITGITHMASRVQIRIEQNKDSDNSSYYGILDELATNMISIDLINVFPGEKIFTIDSSDFNKFNNIMENLNLHFSYINDCSKIAIIGNRMRGIPGVMAKILRALSKQEIEVLQSADSHTTIWCLVKSKNTKAAIMALHNEFNLGTTSKF